MEDKYNLKELVMYVVIIMAVLLIFYGVTLLITSKQNNEIAGTQNDVVIDYDTILVQELYNQSEENYYVFAYVDEDKNLSSYNSLIDTYNNLDDSLKVYTIELNNAFNKKYMSEQSNFDGSKPAFKETTLLKIENKKIVDYYEGEDINTILNVLVGE